MKIPHHKSPVRHGEPADYAIDKSPNKYAS